MARFIDFLNKKMGLLIFILIIAVMLDTCSGCNSKSEVRKARVKVDNLEKGLDDRFKKTVSPEELELMLEIERLKIAHSVVYDNNTIVRTKERPDDVMNRYMKEIEKVEKHNIALLIQKSTFVLHLAVYALQAIPAFRREGIQAAHLLKGLALICAYVFWNVYVHVYQLVARLGRP